MFILTIHGKESEGAYSVQNDEGTHVLYLFQAEDDASRYAMMLEEDDYPDMHVLEVDNEIMIKTCESHGYNYTVITSDDIVIPPADHDFI